MVVRGARERARAEVTAEIVAEARRQLAVHGAAALSLRSVARELGMVSSAVYRYVASRDELLTRLIVEAYDSLGATAEAAAAASVGRAPAERFCTVAAAVRSWAKQHEHEYALLYGSPVPGYVAPRDTVGPAARVSLALAGVVGDAHRDRRLVDMPGPPVELSPDLLADLRSVGAEFRAALGRDHGDQLSDPSAGDADDELVELLDELLDEEVIARLVIAWTQLFGLVSFELFGQTRGLISAHDHLFAAATTSMAAFIGLPADGETP